MAKFKHKPIDVDAVRLAQDIVISTDSGEQHGCAGDFLITDADGKQYIVCEALFIATYEPLDEDARILFMLGYGNVP